MILYVNGGFIMESKANAASGGCRKRSASKQLNNNANPPPGFY